MMGARGILGARGAATVRLSRHMFTDAAPKYRNSLEYVKAREKFQRCYVHDPPVWPYGLLVSLAVVERMGLLKTPPPKPETSDEEFSGARYGGIYEPQEAAEEE